ncbi:MAG TPA: UPF0175 family protein [Pirellulaceae bacterium]|jgi:hypothetical protein
MSLHVVLELPPELEQRLRQQSDNLNADIKEAYLLELYRRDKIDRPELSAALRLDRFDTEALLKHHNIFRGSLTMEDLENDRKTLESLFGKLD